MPHLSRRLETIASLIPDGSSVCDVGTDHGFLAIELMKSGKIKKVIASDINEKPLENARKNIENSGVTGISLRLLDGIEGLCKGEADTFIIAGMGGEVIAGILERGKPLWENNLFILQPTTSPEFLRKFLFTNGFVTEKEIPVSENGKVYSVAVCRFCDRPVNPDPFMCYIGGVTKDTPDGKLYIEKQYRRLKKTADAISFIPERMKEYTELRFVTEKIEKL